MRPVVREPKEAERIQGIRHREPKKGPDRSLEMLTAPEWNHGCFQCATPRLIHASPIVATPEEPLTAFATLTPVSYRDLRPFSHLS
jgi:hypothetical protein